LPTLGRGQNGLKAKPLFWNKWNRRAIKPDSRPQVLWNQTGVNFLLNLDQGKLNSPNQQKHASLKQLPLWRCTKALFRMQKTRCKDLYQGRAGFRHNFWNSSPKPTRFAQVNDLGKQWTSYALQETVGRLTEWLGFELKGPKTSMVPAPANFPSGQRDKGLILPKMPPRGTRCPSNSMEWGATKFLDQLQTFALARGNKSSNRLIKRPSSSSLFMNQGIFWKNSQTSRLLSWRRQNQTLDPLLRRITHIFSWRQQRPRIKSITTKKLRDAQQR